MLSWSILQYFWPALRDGLENQFLVFFLSGCLRQVLLYINESTNYWWILSYNYNSEKEQSQC